VGDVAHDEIDRKTEENLKKKFNEAVEDYLWKCDECGQKFLTKDAVEDHQDDYHGDKTTSYSYLGKGHAPESITLEKIADECGCEKGKEAFYSPIFKALEIRGEFTCPECDIEFDVNSAKGEQNFIDHLIEDHDYTKSEAQNIGKYKSTETEEPCMNCGLSKNNPIHSDVAEFGHKYISDEPDDLHKKRHSEVDEKIWEDYPPTEKGGRQAGECEICNESHSTISHIERLDSIERSDFQTQSVNAKYKDHSDFGNWNKEDIYQKSGNSPTHSNDPQFNSYAQLGDASNYDSFDYGKTPKTGTEPKDLRILHRYGQTKESCEICGTEVHTTLSHIEAIERDDEQNREGKYPCQDCDSEFDSKIQLQRHYDRNHSQSKEVKPSKYCGERKNSDGTITCDYDGDTFADQAEYDDHMQTHKSHEADYATIKHGSQKVEAGSAQDRLLHARDLPHSHVHTEDGKKEIKRYGKGTGENIDSNNGVKATVKSQEDFPQFSYTDFTSSGRCKKCDAYVGKGGEYQHWVSVHANTQDPKIKGENIIEEETKRVTDESTKVKENIDNLKCTLCNRQFKNEDDYKDHMTDAHDEASEYSSIENILAMAKSA
jgi:uncharacterized C2H2 Zn-finger protein